MKRIMLIAYDFPPRGASGVFRMAKFARYLPMWGWQPVVVTAADAGPHPDPQLLDELPADLEILRVGGIRRRGGRRVDDGGPVVAGTVGGRAWRSRLKPWIVPDPQLRWVPSAISRARARLKKGDIQAIITSGPPFSTHLVGLALKRSVPHVPWLMDLRDPWSEAPNQQLLVPYKLNRMLELQCLQAAERVIVVTDGMRQLMMERMGVAPERITTITNGFDSDDLARLPRGGSRAQGEMGPLCLRYVGSLVGLRAEAAMGVFAALERLQAEGVNHHQLQMQFIGAFAQEIYAAAASLPELVEVLPFVSHGEAVERMATADVLLLVLTNDLEGQIMHTSKLFEYLALGRPILNIAPKGDVSNLIARLGAGISVRPTDIDGITEGIRGLLEQHQTGHLKRAIMEPARLQQFERRELAGQLAHLLNHLTGTVLDARA